MKKRWHHAVGDTLSNATASIRARTSSLTSFPGPNHVVHHPTCSLPHQHHPSPSGATTFVHFQPKCVWANEPCSRMHHSCSNASIGSFPSLSSPSSSSASACAIVSDQGPPPPPSPSLNPVDALTPRAATGDTSDLCSCSCQCNVAKFLDHCVLQPGLHHTQTNVITLLGQPLTDEICCYPVNVQWFKTSLTRKKRRSSHERVTQQESSFQIIPNANRVFFTPCADDIGCRLLAKVLIQDEDEVIKTKMLEYGPIQEDPDVRSKVETYLERKSVLFMGLHSVIVQDGSEYVVPTSVNETWSVLLDDKRVRITCDSSLLPPLESFYTSQLRVEILRDTPNEFVIHTSDESFMRLRAESHLVRDILVLTLRAFCDEALGSESFNDLISEGNSALLTLRQFSVHSPTSTPVVDQGSSSYQHLPWHRETDPRASSPSRHSSGQNSEQTIGEDDADPDNYEESADWSSFDDRVLSDADALIGNAMGMGLHHQVLPKSPHKISLSDIADLQIVELLPSPKVTSAVNNKTIFAEAFQQSLKEFCKSQYVKYKEERLAQEAVEDPIENDIDDFRKLSCVDVMKHSLQQQELPPQEQEQEQEDVQAFEMLKNHYCSIFCALQTRLKAYKDRLVKLNDELQAKTETLSAFQCDVELLRGALSVLQFEQESSQSVADAIAKAQSNMAVKAATNAENDQGVGDRKTAQRVTPSTSGMYF